MALWANDVTYLGKQCKHAHASTVYGAAWLRVRTWETTGQLQWRHHPGQKHMRARTSARVTSAEATERLKTPLSCFRVTGRSFLKW